MAEAEELISREENLHICDRIYVTLFNDDTRASTARKLIWVLKPLANTVAETPIFPPLSPTSAPYIGRVMPQHFHVHFEGWTYSSQDWHLWFTRLKRKYSRIWEKACIKDAIMNSLCFTPHNQDFVLGLVKYWCPSSNTFVFPWAETTITLEDVWILGGFSVLGSPVSLPLPSESVQTLEKITQFQINMSEKYPWKTEQAKWINFFMREETEHELEHVAFLSIWLSRFVFPFKDPEKAINRDVFAIAIHLSQGKKLALAPAVLAGVYHYLSLLKEKAFPPMADKSLEDYQEIIPGPFQLVHHWALERFPDLAPTLGGFPSDGPRAAKWSNRDLMVDAIRINRDLKFGPQRFRWRPYLLLLINDPALVLYYRSDEQVVVNGRGSDKELSFLMCLCACELEGVAGVPNQKYMPHRVARQFGINQHLPGEFADMKANNRIDMFTFFSFLIPLPRFWNTPVETVEYYNWWQKSNEKYEQELYAAAKSDHSDIVVD